MASTTLQKKDDSMKGIIFIILGAVLVMCLALATGLLRPNSNLSRWDSEYRLKLNATVCECP